MQRVRVGLTGLACVFLLVMLAAVFLHAAGDAPADPGGNQAAAADNAATPPNEPLAQLGVAPGNAPGDSAEPAVPVPPPASPSATASPPRR